jgi:GMP synthase (glutamine-hydrolysing)
LQPILVCQHTVHEPTGTLADAFRRSGLDWVECRQFEATPPAFDVRAHAGLVVLGGPMNADETDRYPFLDREVAWLQAAVDCRVPVLGICLGAQLLAKALGAPVYRNPVPEIGWSDVTVTPAGQADPLLRHLAPAATVFHWHNDTFDLPAGAVLLAASTGCRNQAFRFGTNAYGVQFHPEITAAILDDWLAALPAPARTAICRQTPRHLPPLIATAGRMFQAWTELPSGVNGVQ